MNHEDRIEEATKKITHPSSDPNARLVPLRKLPGAKRRLKLIRGSGRTARDMQNLGTLTHKSKTWAEKRATTGKRRG